MQEQSPPTRPLLSQRFRARPPVAARPLFRSRLVTAIRCAAIAVFLLTPGLTIPSRADATPPDFTEIARAFGFSEEQAAAMRSGEVVSGELDANSDNELALSLAFLSEREIDWHADRLRRLKSSDPSTREIGLLEGDGLASLQELELPNEELDRLAEAAPGEAANLSAKEIELLVSAAASKQGDTNRRSAVQEAMRQILAARFVAYRDGGLAALAPYARGGDESNPADQLERAFEALQITRQIAPDVYQAMSRFPAPPAPGVESRFLWVMHEAQERMVVALSHVVYGKQDGRLALIERRFYVSHSLNSLQVVSVATPIDEGTAVLYANRTGTDQITGFGSAVAKSVGRKIMKNQLESMIDAFLESSRP